MRSIIQAAVESREGLLQVGKFKEAEADCGKALQGGPNAKALLRRGTARAALSDIQGAVQDFKHVLTLEPTNRLDLCTASYVSKGQNVSLTIIMEAFQSLHTHLSSFPAKVR